MADPFSMRHPHAVAPDTPPAHWPEGVRHLSIDGMALIGVDADGLLYFDGKPVAMRRQLDLTLLQAVFAGAALLALAVQTGLDVARFLGFGAHIG
ncbi:MAG: hypothetical protein GC204_03685 [Chloroflexi bacterium]|nr:hypothetical protein [Chloroflexota bacterium]